MKRSLLIKKKSPVLAFYDSSKLTIVGTDASSFGVRATFYHEFKRERKSISFVSWTLKPVERNYAQIEKECFFAFCTFEKFYP